jgi:hypothetical protein
MLVLSVLPIRGQEDITPPDDADLANHAYTNDVGFGGYSVGEETSGCRSPTVSALLRTTTGV